MLQGFVLPHCFLHGVTTGFRPTKVGFSHFDILSMPCLLRNLKPQPLNPKPPSYHFLWLREQLRERLQESEVGSLRLLGFRVLFWVLWTEVRCVSLCDVFAWFRVFGEADSLASKEVVSEVIQ